MLIPSFFGVIELLYLLLNSRFHMVILLPSLLVVMGEYLDIIDHHLLFLVKLSFVGIVLSLQS